MATFGDFIGGLGRRLNLPEFGISERLGESQPRPQPQRSVQGAQSRPVTVPSAAPFYGQSYGPSGGSTSSAPQPQPQPQQNFLDQIGQNTQSLYDDQLNRARSLYDSRAAELNNQLSGLGQEKDSFLDRIGSTYSGLVQTAGDTLQKNLGLLEGRKGEVNQQYDVSRTNASRLLGDQQRQNRMLARAQNLLSSGYYTNLQSSAGRDATQRIAGLNTEEGSKVDAIGNAILGAQTDTNTKIQTLKEEQANQEQETINKYSTLANSIRNDLRFNERDRLDALESVNNRMASALDNIGLTFMQFQAAAGQLGNTASNYMNQIQSFNPLASAQPTLDRTQALSAAGQQFASPLAGVPAGNQNFLSTVTGEFDQERNRPRSFLDLIG